MKKTVALITVLVMTCTSLAGCAKLTLHINREDVVEEIADIEETGAESRDVAKTVEESRDVAEQGVKTYNVMVQGAIFGDYDDARINTEVSFDPAWVTVGDNTKYNKDLAALSAILSSDIYFRAKDLESGKVNRVLYEGENPDEYEITAFLKEIGFTEVQFIESFRIGEYEYDGNDSVTMLLAHRVVDDKYDLYAAVVRGCFSIQEWLSMFDPGYYGAGYTELTGEHPEWTDEGAHKGIDVAKTRALEFIDEFIEQNDNPDLENCILVTGHSRGGAISEMVGAVMEDREDIKSYTYAFNSLGVTTDERAGEYNTIFNIFDSDDFFTNPLPFGEEKLFRYGRELTLPIKDSAEVKAAITALNGKDEFTGFDWKEKNEYERIFGERFKNRESLYDMKTVVRIYDTEEEALARVEECRELIGSESGLGLEKFCSVEDMVETEGKYEVSMNYCDGAILQAYAKTLAYGTPAYNASVNLFAEDEEVCEILGILVNVGEKNMGSHRLINSFVLTGYLNR